MRPFGTLLVLPVEGSTVTTRKGIDRAREFLVDDAADIDPALLDRLAIGGERIDFVLPLFGEHFGRPELDVQWRRIAAFDFLQRNDTRLRHGHIDGAGQSEAPGQPRRDFLDFVTRDEAAAGNQLHRRRDGCAFARRRLARGREPGLGDRADIVFPVEDRIHLRLH